MLTQKIGILKIPLYQRCTSLENLSWAIAEHHIQTEHKIMFQETNILARIPYFHQINIRGGYFNYKTAE